MLLRRMIEHVKAQNWTAVALDFFIVVVGVFMGIQLGNWNERLSEKSQEADILQGIAADVRRDRAELRNGLDLLHTSISAGNYTLAKIGDPPVSTSAFTAQERATSVLAAAGTPIDKINTPDLTEDGKTRLWSQLLASYFPTSGMTSYDALTSTGKLGIISDPALVDAIQNYYRLRAGLDGSHNHTMRPLRNDILNIGLQFGLEPFTEMPEAEFLEKLAAHEQLRAAYRAQHGYKILHLQEMTIIDNAASVILEKIADKGTD